MRNNIKGVIIGSAGAVFLSVVGAAVYDFIKGNDVFATFGKFVVSLVRLMAKKIAGSSFPVWLMLLILLAVVVATVTIIQRKAEKKRRKKVVRYRLVRQPQKKG
jgi:chromate transport protein ChrA